MTESILECHSTTHRAVVRLHGCRRFASERYEMDLSCRIWLQVLNANPLPASRARNGPHFELRCKPRGEPMNRSAWTPEAALADSALHRRVHSIAVVRHLDSGRPDETVRSVRLRTPIPVRLRDTGLNEAKLGVRPAPNCPKDSDDTAAHRSERRPDHCDGYGHTDCQQQRVAGAHR